MKDATFNSGRRVNTAVPRSLTLPLVGFPSEEPEKPGWTLQQLFGFRSHDSDVLGGGVVPYVTRDFGIGGDVKKGKSRVVRVPLVSGNLIVMLLM